MSRIRNTALSITSNQKIPLSLRRKIGKCFIKLDDTQFNVEIDGRTFYGTLDNYIEWVVYITRNYFEYTYINLVKSLVRGGTALDIGGNVGNHAHAFSVFFEEVISFEPFDLVANRLEAKARKLPNLRVCRVGLSDKNDVLKFSIPQTSNLGTGKIDESGSVEVPVAIGDEYLKGKYKHPINFIKIDVEGHEMQVLAGLKNTLIEHRPVVMFEVPTILRKDKSRSIKEAIDLFPNDYQFVALRGQSTFPTQTNIARVYPLDRDNPKVSWKITYMIGYGPERSFKINGTRITSDCAVGQK